MKVIFEVTDQTSDHQIARMSNAMSALGFNSGKAATAVNTLSTKLEETKEETPAADAAKKQADKKPVADKKPATSKNAPVIDPGDKEPGEDNKPVTMEKIRALVQAKAVAGKKDEIKSLLEEYGVAKVPDLAKEHYADFYERVEKL